MDYLEILAQVGTVLIPLLFALSIFLFLTQYIERQESRKNYVSLEAELETIGVSEVADLLELTENAEEKKRQKLDAWSQFWLKSFERVGNHYEDLKAPGRNVIFYMIGGAVIGFVMLNFLGAIMALFAIPLMLVSINSTKAQARSAKIDTQLLSLVQAMEQNVTSGFIPSEAFIKSIPDIPNPLREELSYVADSVKSGQPLIEAMNEFADRHESREIKFFASSMAMSLERGADIVPQLKVIGDKLEKRQSLRQKVAEIVSQNKALIYVVGGAAPAAIVASELGLVGGGMSMDSNGNPINPSWIESSTSMFVLVAILAVWGVGMFLSSRTIAGARKF